MFLDSGTFWNGTGSPLGVVGSHRAASLENGTTTNEHLKKNFHPLKHAAIELFLDSGTLWNETNSAPRAVGFRKLLDFGNVTTIKEHAHLNVSQIVVTNLL